MSPALLRALSTDVLQTCTLFHPPDTFRPLQCSVFFQTVVRTFSSSCCYVSVTPKVLAALSQRAPSWLSHSGGRADTEGLLLHLALRSPNSGPAILKLLLDCADPPDAESIPTTVAEQSVHTNARLFLGKSKFTSSQMTCVQRWTLS